MSDPAAQFGSSIRLLVGSFGFQANPMNTANVKRELTFIMPSNAVMWMVVPNFVRPRSSIFLGGVSVCECEREREGGSEPSRYA